MKIRKAVSLVITTSDKVFIGIRQNHLRSFPGYSAFAGGKIDRADHTDDCPDGQLNAVYREGQEELGVDFLKNKSVISTELLTIATSPDFNPIRFETYFYHIHMKSEVDFDLDHNEFAQGEWLYPSEILSEWEMGARLLVSPIKKILEFLAKEVNSLPSQLTLKFNHDIELPSIETISGLVQIMPLSDTVPPAERTNAFVVGDKEKILIDPAPRDEGELQKLLNEIHAFNISAIFLTHHHPDHHRNLTKLLEHLRVGVIISKDSYDRILQKHGDDYFFDSEIQLINHLDVIGKWKEKDLVVHHIPGHDEGHYGLAPTTLEWFIVGDLFQGVGTVVIGPDEGDMIKYFNTLKYVIDLSPKCVIPSHGIALGGVSIIEKNLNHRMMREKQVFELLKNGLSKSEMLEQIYFNVPEEILPYAEANIESHIVKLKVEGRI